MIPDRIRLIHLRTKTVRSYIADEVSWDKVWTISHIWDRGEATMIPLKGVSWKSTSFSSENRFNVMLEKTRQIAEARGAEYVWIDAACIHQENDDDRKEQVPLMGKIYSKSAGAIAFGTLSPEDQFVQIAAPYDDGRKAWVCDWFERVWTFQELQLPKVLLFVSGDHVLTRDEVYLSILMMSPYLTSPHLSPPSRPNDPQPSIQDVINALSPLSRTNTQRALMQTSKRGCSSCHVHDKVYGILGVLPRAFSQLRVDYDVSVDQMVLDLMMLMPSNDVLDTLMFNRLPPETHDATRWSGMLMLDQPTEHPSYETDIYYSTNAFVAAAGELSHATTVVYGAPLWKIVVTKPKVSLMAGTADTEIRAWPAITALARFARLTDDFSKVERSANYASAVGRAERSLSANRTLLEPLLRKNAGDGCTGSEDISSLLQNPPSKADPGGIPPNRLGDTRLFDQEVTVLVCRSKADKSFHYGIVVAPNEDGTNTWHKVCTAAFSDSCIVANRDHVESKIVIGR